MSIVKVDSIPFQFDFTGGCNCCNCRGKQTVYINSHGEVEPFDTKKSKDHEQDFMKSLQRIKSYIQNFLEIHSTPDISKVEKEVLESIEGEKTLRLKHVKTINRKLWEIWGTIC